MAAPRQTVKVTLRNYWHETILKTEALRRLKGRRLRARVHDEIAKDIPDRAEHYLTFEANMLREYVTLGRGPTFLLLLLPIRRDGNKAILEIRSGARRHGARQVQSGRRVLGRRDEFHISGETLIENDIPREVFRRYPGPKSLDVDVSFISPEPTQMRLRCSCGLCEWVHSMLDIHWADCLCCLGTCGCLPEL